MTAEEEKALVEEFSALDDKLEDLRRRIRPHFFNRAQAAAQAGNFDEAQAISRQCPDEVTKCFIWDMIRQEKKRCESKS
jgi:hypothetical protein